VQPLCSRNHDNPRDERAAKLLVQHDSLVLNSSRFKRIFRPRIRSDDGEGSIVFVHSICRSSCLNLRFLAPCMPSRAAVQRSLTIKHQGGIESIRPSHHPSERSPQSFHQNTHKHQSRLNVMPLGFRGLKPDRGSSFSAFCVLHKLRSPDSSAFLSPSSSRSRFTPQLAFLSSSAAVKRDLRFAEFN
jgi:hypothetical protein